MYRNPKLLKLASKSPCQCCGIEDFTIVAAHSNQLIDGKGMGIKAHDYRIAYLCYKCHSEIDQGKMSATNKTEMWEYAHRKTIGWLFEQGYIDVRSQ